MKPVVILTIVIIQLLAMGNLAVAIESKPQGSAWVVELRGKQACKYDDNICPGEISFDFSCVRMDTKERFNFTVANEMTQVEFVYTYGSKAIIYGELGSVAHFITVYDLAGRKEIDKWYGYQFSFSHNGRYVAFLRFHPRHTPDEYLSDVVVVYDFASSPSENRVPEARNDKNPENVGIPVFPKENVQKQTLEPFTKLHHYLADLPGAWSNSDTLLSFTVTKARLSEMEAADYTPKEIIVVGIDLARGLGESKTYERHLPTSDLLKPGIKDVPKIRVPIESLSVSDDGAVELRTTEPNFFQPVFRLNLFPEPGRKMAQTGKGTYLLWLILILSAIFLCLFGILRNRWRSKPTASTMS